MIECKGREYTHSHGHAPSCLASLPRSIPCLGSGNHTITLVKPSNGGNQHLLEAMANIEALHLDRYRTSPRYAPVCHGRWTGGPRESRRVPPSRRRTESTHHITLGCKANTATAAVFPRWPALPLVAPSSKLTASPTTGLPQQSTPAHFKIFSWGGLRLRVPKSLTNRAGALELAMVSQHTGEYLVDSSGKTKQTTGPRGVRIRRE